MTVADPSTFQPGLLRRKRWVWVLALGLIPLTIAGLSWFFTASLVDHPGPLPAQTGGTEALVKPPAKPVIWPTTKIDGIEAKRILLESAQRSFDRLDHLEGYTATFHRQERVAGVLGPQQIADLKIRNHPFAIYLKFQTPRPGKEVVYAEGHHDNKLIAHNGDWTRRLIPRLAVAPDSALAMVDSRHPVTDAGLLSLSRKLLHFRVLDMDDDDATTALDRTTLADGRECLRSIHTHSKPGDGRPFCYVEVLYDAQSQIPFQITSYDWPEPNHTGPLNLAERYAYENLNLEAKLTPTDFDPTNPEYAFMRF